MADSPAHLEACQEHIGYRFRDLSLLKSALTHSSSADLRKNSNERMEFLGDAVLGLVVCHWLYEQFPDLMEGALTKIKSAVVSRRACANVARTLALDEVLVLGQGMDGAEQLPASLSAAVLEAVIGAIYLDGGLEPSREFILTHFDREIRAATASEHQFNYKSQLQQHAQRALNATPHYDLLDEKGPDHAKCFEIAVTIGRRQFPSAWGPSKKEAEQRAAQLALVELGQLSDAELNETAAG
ncbi:MAG: ribonuclease III [Phycisphaerae bacterium]